MPQNTHYPEKIARIILFDHEFDVQKLKIDTFILDQANLIDNNILSVIVSYTGGCNKHNFSIVTVPQFKSTNLGHEVNLTLTHQNNGDACKKIVRESLYFDLFPLRERYQQVYGLKADSITLRLREWSIKYPLK